MHLNCIYTVISGCKSSCTFPKLHPSLIEASEGEEIVVSWQGNGRLPTNLETREAKKQDRKPKERSVRQADDMLGKFKKLTLNTVELPWERNPETLSPHSDADASNQVKVENLLPPGQKCTYTVMKGCKSRASVPKIHSGNSSQNFTYTIRSWCESRNSVPKIHPKNIFGNSFQN